MSMQSSDSMSARLPKISIVTPCYNAERYIEETICSIVDQEYPNLEYIIIDGGSTDNTLSIIKKYEKYLAYWVSEPDNSPGEALNKGFAKSTGEVMGWLNADDLYLPKALHLVGEVFATFKEVEWLTGTQMHFDQKGYVRQGNTSYKNIYDFLLGDYEWIQQESTFWKRSLWDKAGGYINTDYPVMVDGELWTRFFLCAELYHVNRCIGGFRSHESNRSKTFEQQVRQDMERAILVMKKKLPQEKNKRLQKLEHLFNLEQDYQNQEVGFDQQKHLKLLPHVFYARLRSRKLKKNKAIFYELRGELSKEIRYQLVNVDRIAGTFSLEERKLDIPVI